MGLRRGEFTYHSPLSQQPGVDQIHRDLHVLGFVLEVPRHVAHSAQAQCSAHVLTSRSGISTESLVRHYLTRNPFPVLVSSLDMGL